MTKKEIQCLSDIIDRYKNAIGERDVETLYELLELARALYAAKEAEIDSLYDEILRFSGTLVRNSKVIVELLERLRQREDAVFHAGIMPITLENLSVCPSAQEVYRSGIAKYTKLIFERNVLDDMRLSLELLIKYTLENEKSLENQMGQIGEFLKKKDISDEVRNLISKTIDYLCKYQNHYVKHNDAVNPLEIDYIIEQTSAVINLIIHVM